jgi:hypothetical protein
MDIIAGPVESAPLSGGAILWFSQGGLHPVLPFNRNVPRDPQLPPWFADAEPARLAAAMAFAAHLEVHGEFVLVRGNAEAGLVDLTDSDIERWSRWFEIEARVRGEKLDGRAPTASAGRGRRQSRTSPVRRPA